MTAFCLVNPPSRLMKKSYMAAEDSDTGIKIYLREIGQIPLLTPDQEIELAAKIKKGDREARALMIRSNLRLVVKIAHDYANLGLPLLDLISEGNIGLMKAVERFDPAKGGKLSTYAAWWIKQSIKRALANQSKTIRLPVHLVDKISKMRRVSLQMSEELGREPTDEELGDEIGIASGKVSQLKTVSIRPASLDAPISDDDSTEFGEIVGDEEAQTPFELLARQEFAQRSRRVAGCSGRSRKENHLPAFRSGWREAQDARGSRQEVWCDPRAYSSASEHRALEIASRAE